LASGQKDQSTAASAIRRIVPSWTE
jgi:hypothetical protein